MNSRPLPILLRLLVAIIMVLSSSWYCHWFSNLARKHFMSLRERWRGREREGGDKDSENEFRLTESIYMGSIP